MRFIFKSKKLERLYSTEKGAHRYPPAVVDAFFEVMTIIASAKDKRDLYALKGLRLERLSGQRQEQSSVRLNKQWRLILEFLIDEYGNYLLICDIEDYH